MLKDCPTCTTVTFFMTKGFLNSNESTVSHVILKIFIYFCSKSIFVHLEDEYQHALYAFECTLCRLRQQLYCFDPQFQSQMLE